MGSGQFVDKPDGSAMTMPIGKLSMKVIVFTASLLALLSMVNVKVDRSPKLTIFGENDLVKPGRSVLTVKSVVVEPLFPSLEIRLLVVLVKVAGADAVTSTLMVHVVAAAIRPSVNVMVLPPSGATNSPFVHCESAWEGVAIVTPTGRVLLKAKSVTGETGSLLVMVKVKVLILPRPIGLGVN